MILSSVLLILVHLIMHYSLIEPAFDQVANLSSASALPFDADCPSGCGGLMCAFTDDSPAFLSNVCSAAVAGRTRSVQGACSIAVAGSPEMGSLCCRR